MAERRLVPFDAGAMAAQSKKTGWVRGVGNLIVSNPSFGVQVVHVMWTQGGKIIYDQILRPERGGGVFLPVDKRGRIGLQKQWRPQTNNQEAWARRFPDIDLSEIGRASWEIPRGAGNLGETGKATAVRELQEEAQSQVVSVETLGETNDNTAFSPHMTVVVWGEVDLDKKPSDKPDMHEKFLSGLQFFDHRELAAMQRKGELYCMMTLSSIAAFWMQYPEFAPRSSESGRSRAGRHNVDDDKQLIDCAACKGSGNLLDVSGNPITDGRKVSYACQTCNRVGKVRV